MKLKKIVSSTLKWWYIYIFSFCFLQTINYGLLRIFLHEKFCFWISAFLTLLFSGYLCLAISVVYEKLINFFRQKEKELNQTISNLRNHIDELDNENKELAQKLASFLCDEIHSGNDNIIQTLRYDLSNSKDCIISEMRDGSNELKAVVDEKSKVIIDKSNTLIEAQDKCTEKIINNEKVIATESAEYLSKKADTITELNSTLITALSTELKTANNENVELVKSVDEKIDEKFKQTYENGKSHYTEILQKLDNHQIDLKQDIDSVKTKISKEAKKTDDIIEIGNSIIKNQQQSMEETQRAFVKVCENQDRNLSDIKQTISISNEEATEKEIKEINACYLEILKSHETNNAKFEQKVIELHSETTKLINLLLDNLEDTSEKSEKYINLLGIQISDLSKQNKTNITNLMNELDKNKEQASTAFEKLSEYTLEQKETTRDAEKRIQEHIKELSDYYLKYFDRIDNIQSEILSISHATNALNNLYSKLHNIIKAGKDTQTATDKSERIEEFKDDESGAIVRNHYNNNKLSYSEMIVAGYKTYDVQYDSEGKTSISHNYDKRGEVVSEIEFYRNGQVKTRKEIFVRNGKKEIVISKFDEKGNKIK